MQKVVASFIFFGTAVFVPQASWGAVIYNNLTPNNLIGVATRPDVGAFEIEAADDFVLTSPAEITNASFTGLFVGGTGTPTISDLVVEIYRVFPADSNTTRMPNVPTRANSPSDVAFDSRDSATAGDLTFSTSTVSATFSTLNSIQPGGIHAFPNQATLGDGAVTGQEVQVNVTFLMPFELPSDHYFFVPQVTLSSGQFFWLSAPRPITGAGTTPFPAGFTDLQSWTRDQFLDPDWLRVGTDIVDGTSPPTFNASFSLSGNVLPEPVSTTLVVAGLALLAWRARGRRALR